jgi:hypothetical protein
MKGFIGSISFISLLLATSTEAVNNFTNPGFLPSHFSLPSPVPVPESRSYLPCLLTSFANDQSRRQHCHPSRRRSNDVPSPPLSPPLRPLVSMKLTSSISWQVDTSEPTISLVLKNAQQEIILINQGRNTGSFIWTVPENLPSGTYTFEIGVGTVPILDLPSP